MTLRHLLASAAFAAGLAGAVAANAGSTIIGSESSDGFIGNLLESAFPGTHYMIASDGEVPFHPFGATFDVSDGLDFSAVPFVWTQAVDSTWTPLGSQTWVLPASLGPCGAENEPVCEPTGHFLSPSLWVPAAIGTWVILESPGGPVSDVIKTFNSDLGAELLFYSDPSLPVPEPASWALMLVGFFGMGAVLRGQRRDVAATVDA